MYNLTKIIKLKYSIRFTVLTVFILANALTAGVAISLQYYFSKSMATESAFNYYDKTATQTSAYLEALDTRAIESTKFLSSYPHILDNQWIGNATQQLFAQVMQNTPAFYAIYIGFENGDFYELVNLESSLEVRRSYNAGPTDRWVMVTVIGDEKTRLRELSYFDKDFNLRVTHVENSDYHAAKRPWYTEAKVGEVHKTDPYLFQHLKAPGQTYSTIIPGTSAVLAVDIALSSISTYLKQEEISADGEIYLYQKTGEIIASNQASRLEKSLLAVPKLVLSLKQQRFVAKHRPIKISNSIDWSPIDFTIAGKPQGYAVDIMSIVAASTGLRFEYTNGYEWPELVDMYQKNELDILQAVFLNNENEALGNLSKPFLDLPLSVITKPGEDTISHVEQLSGKTLAITRGWSIGHLIQRYYPKVEIIEVPLLKDVFDAVRDGKAYAGIDSKLILRHLAKQFFIEDVQFHGDMDFLPLNMPNSLHLLMKKEQTQLLALINLALGAITPELKSVLDEKWGISNQTSDSHKQSGIVPYAKLIEIANQKSQQGQLNIHEINGQSYFTYVKPLNNNGTHQDMFAVIVPIERVLGESLNEIKLSMLITGGCLLLMLPCSWFFASPIVNPIRRLSRQNWKIKNRQFDQISHQATNISEIEELSLSMIEMSESIQQHERAQQELLDAFIKIISQAIDDKSHYTAGHCARVPELAIELAHAASNENKGICKDFTFHSEDEVREFTIAAWLHDCGKVTTPEHIVDKGTKLEIIYNRIHEIRMRFEVLWRDAEIEFLKQAAAAPQQETQLLKQLQQTRQQLQDDFEFIAQSNVGGEFMEEAHVTRLKSLTQIKWQRNFDDRLGLSPVEEARYNMNEVSLPVTESLLADKTEHIIKRTEPVEFPAEFEIKVDVPEYLSNQGEVYNLSIGRGTLTAEDRFIINEHIISTIKMLEALPLPPELARVPRYASTHHETLKGTGYPRKLKAEDLSVPERVLVVCDIFEALTAADRPYKKAKPISVAINILHKMALDEHLDIEIFELLLTSGIYLNYARKYLPESQIDEVDISRYIRSPAPTVTANKEKETALS